MCAHLVASVGDQAGGQLCFGTATIIGEGIQSYPAGRPLLSLSQPPFLSFLPSLNLRFFQTAPSPSSPTQRGAERGSGAWLQKEGSGLASFVPDLCAC